LIVMHRRISLSGIEPCFSIPNPFLYPLDGISNV
jgi:hypothetical protein